MTIVTISHFEEPYFQFIWLLHRKFSAKTRISSKCQQDFGTGNHDVPCKLIARRHLKQPNQAILRLNQRFDTITLRNLVLIIRDGKYEQIHVWPALLHKSHTFRDFTEKYSGLKTRKWNLEEMTEMHEQLTESKLFVTSKYVDTFQRKFCSAISANHCMLQWASHASVATHASMSITCFSENHMFQQHWMLQWALMLQCYRSAQRSSNDFFHSQDFQKMEWKCKKIQKCTEVAPESAFLFPWIFLFLTFDAIQAEQMVICRRVIPIYVNRTDAIIPKTNSWIKSTGLFLFLYKILKQRSWKNESISSKICFLLFVIIYKQIATRYRQKFQSHPNSFCDDEKLLNNFLTCLWSSGAWYFHHSICSLHF